MTELARALLMVRNEKGELAMNEPKSFSLHIGLNRVDPAAYSGWDGELGGCEADARNWMGLAQANGWEDVTLLLNEDATTKKVREWFLATAERAKPGARVLVTYAGHGGQVNDENGDEPDRLDETWLLYNAQLVDDQLRYLLTQFDAGVRAVVVSDSCHSGSITRALRPPVSATAKAGRGPLPEDGPSVLTYAACLDPQLAGDTPKGGLFTTAVMEAMKTIEAQPGLGWLDLEGLVRSGMEGGSSHVRRDQLPVLSVDGPVWDGWTSERPFIAS